MNDETVTNEERLAADNLTREYFKPSQSDEIQKAVQEAQEICEHNNLPLDTNFDGDEIPAGYGVAVIPITQRRDGVGNVPIGCYIAAIPEVETVLQHDKGEQWLYDTAINALISKFANAARPRDGVKPTSVPRTVEDFITSASRDQGLGYFREVGPEYVKGLKRMGLKTINLTLLRQVLASASFAAQQFPNIEQSKWEGLLDKMIAKADEKGRDAGIVKVWKETRDQTEIETGDFDLDKLDSLVA